MITRLHYTWNILWNTNAFIIGIGDVVDIWAVCGTLMERRHVCALRRVQKQCYLTWWTSWRTCVREFPYALSVTLLQCWHVKPAESSLVIMCHLPKRRFRIDQKWTSADSIRAFKCTAWNTHACWSQTCSNAFVAVRLYYHWIKFLIWLLKNMFL